MEITIKLRDQNPLLVGAWLEAFKGVAGVEVSCGEIFEASATALVSPANSFGFMDGGIDYIYSMHFGWQLQERLQALLAAEHHGELPVGEAVLVETGAEDIPYLISAPTMRVPMDVANTIHVYLAFRAALLCARRFNASQPARPIRSLLCPGLGTAVGRLPAHECAQQMAEAFDVVRRPAVVPATLRDAGHAHYRLAPALP